MGLFRIFKKKESAAAAMQPMAAEEPEPLKEIDTANESSDSIKQEVEPELALWLANGTTVKSLQELANALKKMKASDYKERVAAETNEIAEWVQEVLNDEELARQLRKAKGKMQAAQQVEKEIKTLRAAAKKIGAEPKTSVKDAKAKRQPRLQAAKVELPLPAESAETKEAEDNAAKPKFSLWPFKKKEGYTEKTETMTELKELELPQFPDFKMQDKDIKIEETPEEMPELKIPLPEMAETSMDNPSPEKKGRFLFFGRKPKQDENEEQPSMPELGQVKNLPPLPTEQISHDDEKSAFEPEPHHEKWTGEQEPQEGQMAAEPTPYAQPEEAEIPKAGKPKKAMPKAGKAEKTKTEPVDDAGLPKKMRELDAKEKALDIEEERLNSKKLEVTRKRYEIIKQKGELERERFEEFMKKHKLTSSEIQAETAAEDEEKFSVSKNTASTPARDASGFPGFRQAGAYGKEMLEGLLEEAKQHIRENNVEEAQRALNEIQSAFNTVFMTTSEKKQIEYEILEVEADLKLASLK